MDAATGKKRWAFRTDDAVLTAPAVANGMAYVGSKDSTVCAVRI